MAYIHPKIIQEHDKLGSMDKTQKEKYASK